MKSYFGYYRQSAGSEPLEATVLVFDKSVHIGYPGIAGEPSTLQWNINDLEVAFEPGIEATRIRNTRYKGIEVDIEGNDAALFIKSMQQERAKPWHQQEKARDWGRNLLIFLGIVTGLVILYFLVVPWLSERMASRVSVKTEEGFGEAVYDALGIKNQEDTAASAIINEFFNEMNVRTAYNVRFTVANSETMNAFALPGGRIVIYSALLAKMESYPELAALLAHEFTHVNNRHSTKSIFRRLGSRIFLGLLFGKFGSVTGVLVDNADNLKSLKYSRRLEKEADMDGLAMLMSRKIDPRGFANLFEHLRQASSSSSMPELLGSHPNIEKRINYIMDASVNAQVEENTRLKIIFEKLKQTIK